MAPSANEQPGFVGSAAPSLSSLTSSRTLSACTRAASTTASAAIATPQPTSLAPLVRAAAALTVSVPTLCTQPSPQRIGAPFAQPPPAGGASDVAVVLFRSDLRLDDHPALTAAIERCSTVVPVFCFDPRHFGRTEHGFDKTGKYRARFLIESVKNLRENLRKRGADLVVRLGEPEKVVADIVATVGASHVYLHREVTVEEQAIEKSLSDELTRRGVETCLSWANTLYHCDDMPFSLEDMPDVYSDFREAVEARGKIREPLPWPEELCALPQQLELGEVPTLQALGIADYSTTPVQGVCAVTGGEDEAMRRVQAYVADSRRVETGSAAVVSGAGGGGAGLAVHIGADFSCRISPWLALGCVSPRRIFREMGQGGITVKALLRSSTYFELVWRDFFRCITAKYSEKRAAVATGKKGAVGTGATVRSMAIH